MVLAFTPAVLPSASRPQLVRIESGSFLMGGSRDDERPLHEVVIARPFLLAATEVTRGMWQSVMDHPAGYFTACGDDCPLESVTWDDAIAFCNALSRKSGLDSVYTMRGDSVTWRPDADGYRLPTEAEWEYACRAGTTTPFAGGACLDPAAANFDGYHPLFDCPSGVYRQQPVPVASFAPNPWGLYDMHGNVSEWCWDAYARYGEAPRDGALRCYRGGSWADGAIGCRAAVRYSLPRSAARDQLGLRLARTIRE